MKITNLKIAKLLSFGLQQELKDFTYFNLFIGKNGSGKTNAFNILQGLDVDYEIVGSNIIDTSFKVTVNYFTGIHSENREINVFAPSIIMKNYTNRDCHSSNIFGNFEISYEIEFENSLHTKIIKFSNDPGGTIRFTEGDFSILSKRVKFLEIPSSESDFYKDLALFFGSKAKSRLPFLNFALFYIFGLNYRFFENGTFVQAKNSNGGNVEENTTSLPSGVLNCAKIITRYLMAIDESVILIDEPELHLEPRVLRKLFQFIVWLNVKGKTGKTVEEQKIFDLVESVIGEHWNKEIGASKWAVIESVSEDKTTYYDVAFDPPQKQLFIASHSSVLINEFLNLGNEASIYKFDLVNMEFLEDDQTRFPEKNFTIANTGLFTKVEEIATNSIDIIENLGCKGSDILQTNGIIWVEGPSDIVYIQKWLQMYAEENTLYEFRQSSDFEFCMYGGALLKFLYGAEEQEAKQENLVNILKLNRRGFIIVDSDKPELTAEDKSTFAEAKQLMKDILGENQFWGDEKVQTIEKYATENKEETWKYHVNCIYEAKGGKPERAFRRVQLWESKGIKISDFEPNLLPNIEKLYKAIESWNQ